MKKYLIVLLSLYVNLCFSQEPTIDKDLPKVVPPSPTVAALMKFQEVPVSNYTGVPNISIPLFSSPTLSKNINLNLSLEYHTSGVAADERASDVGLGWSLFAGGTISRTVRGLPDEIYDTQGIVAHGTGKLGLYQDNADYPNNFNEVIDLYNNTTLVTNEVMNKYLWNAAERGVYDTEYDLWQFNFMGQSGQFTIKKNIATHVLEVKNLDIKSNLKIINIYNPTTYEPLSFIVYDDLGYKYVFDIVEETTTNTTTDTKPRYGEESATASENMTFNSAFHLTGIYDNNNKLLLEINYNDDFEVVMDSSLTVNDINPLSVVLLDNLQYTFTESTLNKIDPKFVSTTSKRTVKTKKINSILVEGIAKIYFNYQTGRADTNFFNPSNSDIVKGLVVKNWYDNNIKKIELEYGYSTVIDTRLMLENVKFLNFIDSKEEKYELEYYVNTNTYGANSIKKDLWGYFKIPNFVSDEGREVNPSFCTTDLLQKMTLPTGGSIVFDFEANTYSNIRSRTSNNFDENPNNWHEQILATSFYPTDNTNNSYIVTNPKYFFTITEKQDVLVKGSFITSEGPYDDQYIFNVFKMEGGVAVPISQIGLVCIECMNYPQAILNQLDPGEYLVSLSCLKAAVKPIFQNATITAYFKVKNENNFQFLYGGGNRIKRIGYFKDNVAKEVYQNLINETPDKEKIYNYNSFESPLKSSGSLVIDKPIYEYDYASKYYLYADGFTYTCPVNDGIFEFMFTRRTDYNNIKAVKTSGADVGYQNVKISEANNGETRFTYTSPIDKPDSDALVDTYPFELPFSRDYERGLLLEEKIFDQSGKPLNQNTFKYDFDEEPYEESLFGLSAVFVEHSSPFSYLFSNYDNFKYVYDYLQLYGPNSTGSCCPFHLKCSYYNEIKLPREFINMQLKYNPNGWAKLASKTTKSYFYPSSGSPANILQTVESYRYNGFNKKIAESKVINSKGETLITKYFYHIGNSVVSQNRISEIEQIETYKDSTLLSTSKIIYANDFAGNDSYLPHIIQTAKGAESLENRVSYNSYDEYGHPLELQKENGTKVCYIWGYNKTQPIAKIENASSAEIETALGIPLTTVDETNLSAIDGLRTTMRNAMITTYTYIPLVGVNSITDPKGYTTYYEYDSFGRLNAVKDADGHFLSENEYHYRTQN